MLPKGLLKEYARPLSIMVRLIDMLTIFVAGWLAYVWRFGDYHLAPFYLSALLLALCLCPLVFSFFNLYASIRGKGFISHISTLVQSVGALGLILAGLSFFTKSGDVFARTWFVLWIGLSLLLLILTRCSLLFLLHFMRTRGLNERRVVIFGCSDLGVKFAETIQEALWTGFRVISIIDDEAQTKPTTIHAIPVLQTPSSLSDYLRQVQADEIWLALPLRAEDRMKEILFELRHHTINTRFVLDIFGMDLLNHSITDIAGFPVLNIHSSPMRGVNRLIKAIEDRMIG